MTNRLPYLTLNHLKFEKQNHSVLFVLTHIGIKVCSLKSKNKIYGS